MNASHEATRSTIQCLVESGIVVKLAPCLEDALHFRRPELLLLLVEDLSYCDTAAVIATIRAKTEDAGLIVVCERDAQSQRIATALDDGADDVLCTPYTAMELAARVRALHRRQLCYANSVFSLGVVTFDAVRGELSRERAIQRLSRKESAVLELLVKNRGTPVTRTVLQRSIWKVDVGESCGSNVVDVYVSYIRRKLSQLGVDNLIRSVRGVGYSLAPTRVNESTSSMSEKGIST